MSTADQPATAATILDCPGEGNGCRCACHGCKYHCSAHDPTRLWDEPEPTTAARNAVIKAALATPRCPSRSPESLRECRLPDLADAHLAGHESRRYGRNSGEGECVSWATTERDHVRWGTGTTRDPARSVQRD